jgi:hypothetical protein
MRSNFLDCHLCNVYRFILVLGDSDCPYWDHVAFLMNDILPFIYILVSRCTLYRYIGMTCPLSMYENDVVTFIDILVSRCTLYRYIRITLYSLSIY